MHSKSLSCESHASSPGVKASVVYFCHGALKAHIGNVHVRMGAVFRSASISGIFQRGPCSSERKRRGYLRSPRSAGFSMAT